MSGTQRSPSTIVEGVTGVGMTANERFKDGFRSWFWGSMVVATLLHFMLLAYFPQLQAADITFDMVEIEAITLPPEVDIPPPPEAITRPANPVVTGADIDPNVTIAPTVGDDLRPGDLPPPPIQGIVDVSAQPTFTPYEVAPDVRNRDEVAQALRREYPPLLRDMGVGGVVLMWFYINELGQVTRFQVQESSGYAQLDEAALRVAPVLEFTPALNRDQRVPVWVQIPIEFETVPR